MTMTNNEGDASKGARAFTNDMSGNVGPVIKLVVMIERNGRMVQPCLC